MNQPLTPQQSQWVESTLSKLSLEESLAQLLCVSQGESAPEYWLRLIEKTPVGSIRARTRSAQAYRELLTAAQNHSPIPLLIPANMEHGASELGGYGTDFPWPMAAGAANDEALMRMRGEAVAVEARHIGVNWVFHPVVDLNYNPNNPITNVRSMGDQPERVSRLAVATIAALQANGLAATAKHFPGDGIDDRDQHLLTTINSLPFDQWLETFGQVWRNVIDAGVMCIMPGHISLPDYQGYRDDPAAAPPATLDSKLLIDLLRGELGFDGMIVSDNAGMIGLTIHTTPEDQIVQSIASGIDMYLNADPEHDFDRLLQGVHDGRLSEERVQDATRRVLAMKARLNLFDAPAAPAPTAEQHASFAAAAQTMADKSVTILRQNEPLTLTLEPGTKVLTVTYGQFSPMFGESDLEEFDKALGERGFAVTHLLNPGSDELRQAAEGCQAVFINLSAMPFVTLANIRMTDTFRTWGWRSLYRSHPQVVYTAFGNPYIAYEAPQLPRLITTYGRSTVSQRAAVKFWLGEIEAQGSLPVQMPQVQIKAWPVSA
ncbi:MAG: glycoside hydrolase family 3 N-terminal domain-containing protein [Caldilineaceae bacterium]